MNRKLVRLLLQNKDLILENWFTEIDLPFSNTDKTHGEISFDYLQALFEELLGLLLLNNKPAKDRPPLTEFIDYTLSCEPGKYACAELYRSGVMAIFEVLDADDFHVDKLSDIEQSVGKKFVENALVRLIHEEIDTCCQNDADHYCPLKKIGVALHSL